MFLFGAASAARAVEGRTRCAMAPGRTLASRARRDDQAADRERGRRREPAARVRRADPRAGPALPAALRRQGPRRERRRTSRSSAASRRSSSTQHALVEIVAGRRSAPTRPAGAGRRARDFDVPAPPPIAELAALPPRAPASRCCRTRASRTTSSSRGARAGQSCRARSMPAEFDDRREHRRSRRPAIELGPDELPPGADSGLLLHDVFEHADLAGRARSADAEAWRADPTVAALIADQRARARHRRALSAARSAARPRDADRAARAHRRQRAARRSSTRPRSHARSSSRIRFRPPARRRAGSSKASSTRWSRRTTSSGCSTTRATCSAAPTSRPPRASACDEHYSVQARLYALAADRLRGRRRLARPAVRVRAPRRRRAASRRRRRARDVVRRWLANLRDGDPR